MESKTSGKNIIIALLSVLLVASLVFIGYDKLLKKDNNTSSNINNTNSATNSSNTSNNQTVEKLVLNEEKVKKWLDDNYFIKSQLGNYDKKTATNDYTDFLLMYIGSKGENAGTDSNHRYRTKILKTEGETIVKKYFDVDDVVIDFNNIKRDSTSLYIPSSDDTYYYVALTAMDGIGWNTKYIQTSLNNNNEIEVLYALVGLYENGNHAYDYYGFKKITLKEVNNSFKIIKIEENVEKRS